MDERSTFWILTVGVILIQAPHSKANVIRRNLNSNTNMNSNMMEPMARFFRSTRRPPMYDEDDMMEYISPRDTYPKSMLTGSDPANVAAVASAAADATLAVTKNLAEDMSETAAIAVADAVSRILSRSRRRPGLGRRSSNINTNYNYNLLGPASLTDPLEDRDTILESDVSQSKDSSAMMEDYQGNMDKRYFVAPGRDVERTKWDESRYGDRERIEPELSRNDWVRPSRCSYQPSVCRMRRTRPFGKLELMDDHASVPIEETKSGDLLGEVDGLDVDKELLEEDKDDALLSNEFLNTPSNVTALIKPVIVRGDKNRNTNQNLNADSRRFIVNMPTRRRPQPTRRPPLQFPRSGW